MRVRKALAVFGLMSALSSILASTTLVAAASARLDHAPCRAPLAWNADDQACEVPPPSTTSPWPGKALVDAQTGFCLTANTAGQVIATWCAPIACYLAPYPPCQMNRQWVIVTTARGSTLHVGVTGLCLDSNAAGQLYALACNGGDYQNWIISSSPLGGSTLRDVATGLCLDSNDNLQAYTLACNGGEYQSWLIG